MLEGLSNTQESPFEIALAKAAFHEIEGAGFVQLDGETQLDFLQRQSTNDMGALKAELGVPNILTSATGRILEVFLALQHLDGIAMLTPSHRGPHLAEYFQKRIFFNDKVAIQDQSLEWVQFELLGMQTTDLFKSLFGINELIEENNKLEGEIADHAVQVIRSKDKGGYPTFRLVAHSNAKKAILAGFQLQDVYEIAPLEFELFRIQNGIAGSGEILSDFTPFEVGLEDWVSDTKGCYTGQEVLARQITYDKVVKGLAIVSSEEQLDIGAVVKHENKTIGKITSSIASLSGDYLGLAVLKKASINAGDPIAVIFGDEESKASIVALKQTIENSVISS